jgi:hypothetical protein
MNDEEKECRCSTRLDVQTPIHLKSAFLTGQQYLTVLESFVPLEELLKIDHRNYFKI